MTTTVALLKVERPLPLKKQTNGKTTRLVWTLRWRSSNGTHHSKAIGDCKKINKRQAEKTQRALQSKFDCDVEAPDAATRITLEHFKPMYLDRRTQRVAGHRGWEKQSPRLVEATVREHDMALRYLIAQFGANYQVSRITHAGASKFATDLAANRLTRARNGKNSRKVGEQRVLSIIRTVKAIMAWAVVEGYALKNPFQKITSAALPSTDNHDVSLADFEKLIKAASATRGDGWVLLIALCRLAGLRLNEARKLPWNGTAKDAYGKEHDVGVDLDGKRIRLMGTQKGARSLRYREVPICPRLAELLHAAADSASGMHETVTDLSPHNLTRHGQQIAKDAKLKPWPKMFQSMRSSCENDWKNGKHTEDGEKVAEPTYCRWIGHSSKVSRAAYVSPQDSEFEQITGPVCAPIVPQ